MEKIKSLVFGALVIVAVAFIALKAGWSPLNLIFGPQYKFNSEPKTNTREHFVSVVVPDMYPKLIQCIQKGPESVRWRAQSGETQSAIISLTRNNSVLIETTIYAGTKEEIGGGSSQAIVVKMLDHSRDGKLNRITYIQPGGRAHDVTAPFDETSQYLWGSSLAMEFREGTCFK